MSPATRARVAEAINLTRMFRCPHLMRAATGLGSYNPGPESWHAEISDWARRRFVRADQLVPNTVVIDGAARLLVTEVYRMPYSGLIVTGLRYLSPIDGEPTGDVFQGPILTPDAPVEIAY